MNVQLQNVKVASSTPFQQHSSTKILRSVDSYQQKFIKYPNVGVFHSYAELLHAALLESELNVASFVPQPYRFRIGRKQYIPDCFYIHSGERIVVEIKPRGELADEIKVPLTEFLSLQNIKFKVVSNEEILERETLALNWLHIIRTLLNAQYEEITHHEIELYESVHIRSELCVGDIIDLGSRIEKRQKEIALFKLTYNGKFKMDLTSRPMDITTMVTLP